MFVEDTDAGGIVYHANYLKYAERARTTLLMDVWPNFLEEMKKEGIIFVVRRAEIEYKKPAVLGDQLLVDVTIEQQTGASLTFLQHIVKDSYILVELRITIVCMTYEGKIARLPAYLKKLTNELMKDRKEHGSGSITTS